MTDEQKCCTAHRRQGKLGYHCPNDGAVNGIMGMFNVGHQKWPQWCSCKSHHRWFCVLKQERRRASREKQSSYCWDIISLEHADTDRGMQHRAAKGKTVCYTLLISGPLGAEHSWCYKIPGRSTSPPENIFLFFFHFKILYFPASLSSFVCSPHWHTCTFISTAGSSQEEI